MHVDLLERHLPGHGQWTQQRHRLSLHLHRSRLAAYGRLHLSLRRNVLQDLARPLNLHRSQAQQEGHQGLSAVHCRRRAVGNWHCNHDDLASCRSVLSRHKATGALCKISYSSKASHLTPTLLIPFQAHPSLEDVLIVRENEYCQSEQMNIFVGVIYAYKGMLLIFGAFLAWETRELNRETISNHSFYRYFHPQSGNVSIPALNDSKHVGLSVYNVVIMCVMGAAIALVLSDQKDAVFILISIFIIFCTTATLILVFVPKVKQLEQTFLFLLC